MTTVASKVRRGRRTAPASVREVCLIAAPASGWSEGDRVIWAGRTYRVEATQPDPGPPDVRTDRARYIHLAPNRP